MLQNEGVLSAGGSSMGAPAAPLLLSTLPRFDESLARPRPSDSTHQRITKRYSNKGTQLVSISPTFAWPLSDSALFSLATHNSPFLPPAAAIPLAQYIFFVLPAMLCDTQQPHTSPSPYIHQHSTMSSHSHPQVSFPSSYLHHSQSHISSLPRPSFPPTHSSPNVFYSSQSSHASPSSYQACTAPSSPGDSPSGATVSQSHSQARRLARPKPLKKSSSTNGKHRNVQMSLEVKVEKAKGFHAFFVPHCKGGVPPAPPCSPVLGHGSLKERRDMDGENEATSIDYFGTWSKHSEKESEQWVENIEEGMEVDRI
ncbi:hypothetical protein LQV05_003472 [Cryptococcus neoformans]|nr:hypothetical protein LQV05_003472 [Cryptococcus neoformans]